MLISKALQPFFRCIAGLLALVAALALAACAPQEEPPPEVEEHTATTHVMDTLVTQTGFGPAAEAALREVNTALAAWEAQLSLFDAASDIAKINAAAGKEWVTVEPSTAALLRQAVALSPQSEGAFAVTIAPLTQAWGVTSERPRVVPPAEREALLQLVDDAALQIEGNRVFLPEEGMGLDLGGIAKGAACSLAQEIYAQHGVDGAWLSIGGNVYAYGTKPGGQPFRIGFRDPERASGAYIASFHLQDEVIAVSGGYERYFESGGTRYIHIIDPRTGAPAESDIVSVGVIHPDGAAADFYSTTLYVWGRERALEFMRTGEAGVILLDAQRRVYVSESLESSFTLTDEAAAEGYTLEFMAKG